jgi:hypothetical protein
VVTTEREATELVTTGPETTELVTTGPETTEREAMELETIGLETTELEMTELETMERETMERETMELETTELETVEQVKMERETTERETMGLETVEQVKMEQKTAEPTAGQTKTEAGVTGSVQGSVCWWFWSRYWGCWSSVFEAVSRSEASRSGGDLVASVLDGRTDLLPGRSLRRVRQCHARGRPRPRSPHRGPRGYPRRSAHRPPHAIPDTASARRLML